MPRHIRLNAFDMNCVGHIQQGLWTHPRDQSTRYLDIHYWTELAQTLEAAEDEVPVSLRNCVSDELI